ncbi:D-alanyl-D-alanine dipeptidase [Magnetospirillum sp. LM-5]|uniref:D-alanyl-D-alanine dipeptidase n=1 Tax=Magnetospirillum sp. LM-5 TaxID=2681466 RepID=UPI00137F8683|nr:D-alanyl-D-alanine dipeptidase [Magnetospirillum sp. LM-5]CAA7618113.1 D-alanyl-D-alanine dipeptidase [Magnetospirillum sp. LM-5]
MLPLVRVDAEALGLDIALAYATPDNFTHRPVYLADAGCFLHADAAPLLARACQLARPLGLRVKVLDAFRPSEAQWVLWNHTPLPGFLADPRRGSPHSMGAAVDLTLVDDASGAELDMGTGFDEFSPLSHHGNQDISAQAQRNRHLLMGIMTCAGWDFYRNEWWHYQLFSPRGRYPVLSDSVLGPNRMMGV